MKRLLSISLIIILGASLTLTYASDSSTKKERNFIREGNSFYNDKNFADAEKLYRKALEENPNSELAAYNLAASLIRQSGNSDINAGNNPLKEASDILNNLARSADDSKIAEYANYNLGNISFNQQQYQQSIELYKNALRRNPNNDNARQNLRLAQLKLQEQQNQQQEQNKDKDQEEQQQNQNKDQQQQNDKKDEQKDNKNEEQKGVQDKKDNKEQQPPKQEQGKISDTNAAKILKTMENEENATRRKVNELKKREEQSQRRRTSNQW